MKKLFLVLVLALTLVGCSAKNDVETVTIWVERVFSDEANDAIEARLKEFADEHNINVDYEFIPATDFMTKLNAAIESKTNIPDIISSSPTKVLNFYPNIPQADMTSIVEDINGDREFIEAIYEGSKIEDTLYFVPFTSSNTLMFVRTDKTETPLPTTWEEVFDFATEISDPANDFFGLGIGSGPTDEDGENMFRMIMWNEGAYIFDEEGNITINSDKTKELLTKYKELYDNGVIPDSAHTWDPGSNNSSYLMGESGIVFNAATLYNAVNTEETKELFDNSAFLTLPSGNVEDTTMGFISGFSIMEASENKETAADLIKFMLDSEWYNSYVEKVAPVFAPVFKDAEELEFWSDGVNKQVIEYAKNSRGYYGYPVKSLKGRAVAARHYFSFPIAELMNNVVTERMSVDEAVEHFSNQVMEVEAEIE